MVGRICPRRNTFDYRTNRRIPDGDDRDRYMGIEPHRRLGFRYHKLCFLDRYRSRRNVYIRDPLPLQPEMAHIDKSFGRSDDTNRRNVRGRISDYTYGTAVAVLLGHAVPEHARYALGAISVRPRFGTSSRSLLISRFHLFFGTSVWSRIWRPRGTAQESDKKGVL